MTKPTANPPNMALVVDDDLDLLEILKAALVDEADFRVLTATVPDLVVPLVEAAPPAVVVLDIALPGQSGWEVLIVSAMPGAKTRVAQLHDPWVEFLAKPVDLETLLKQVQALVERHQQDSDHSPAPDSP